MLIPILPSVNYYSLIDLDWVFNLSLRSLLLIAFVVYADVGMNFVITVEPSGKTRKQHVIAHSGLRIIFCTMRMETLMKKMKKRKRKKKKTRTTMTLIQITLPYKFLSLLNFCLFNIAMTAIAHSECSYIYANFLRFSFPLMQLLYAHRFFILFISSEKIQNKKSWC